MKKTLKVLIPILTLIGVATLAFTYPDDDPKSKDHAFTKVIRLPGDHYRMGVVLEDINPHLRDELKIDSGVLVEEVLPNSAASRAEIREGDIILSIDGKEIDTAADVREILRAQKEQRELTVELLRNGKKLIAKMTPEKRSPLVFHGVGGNYLGVHLQEIDADLASYFRVDPGSGVLVTRVEKNTPAEKAGMRSGDVITAFNGKKVTSSKEIREALSRTKEGETVSITVIRNTKELQLQVQPEQRSLPSFDAIHEMKPFQWHGLETPGETKELMENLKEEMERLKDEMKELKLHKEDLEAIREDVTREVERLKQELEKMQESD